MNINASFSSGHNLKMAKTPSLSPRLADTFSNDDDRTAVTWQNLITAKIMFLKILTLLSFTAVQQRN